MEFSYETQGTNTYLVYKIAEDDVIDSMSLGMLTNNKIAGLAASSFTQMDSTKYIKYNVSSKIPVKQFFSGPVNKKRLIGVFTGIVDAMISSEDYMIDANSIILDLEYIFADVSTCETVLICLPIENHNKESVNLSLFFKNIMFSTQFDQTENCDHVAKIMNYLNSTPVFSLQDFRSILEKIKAENAEPNSAKVSTPRQTTSSATNNQPSVPVNKPVQPVAPTVKPIQTQPRVEPKVQPKETVPSTTEPAKSEKKISMFDLLMHYNKENAELYKSQKAAKKGVVSTPAKSKAQPNMAIPGANSAAPSSMAIPGQAAPAVNQAPAPAVNTKVSNNAPVSATPASAPAYVTPPLVQGGAKNFGETTVLGGGAIGETTVLNAVSPNQTVALDLCQYFGHKKLNIFSLHDINT